IKKIEIECAAVLALTKLQLRILQIPESKGRGGVAESLAVARGLRIPNRRSIEAPSPSEPVCTLNHTMGQKRPPFGVVRKVERVLRQMLSSSSTSVQITRVRPG
ncbi:hypothetical protein AVEN_181407-1, partial [Araneus ventricosus]